MIKQVHLQFKYYSFITMGYILSIVASIIFFNKFMQVGPLLISASLVSYSFTYFFGNAVSEVYGFTLARRLILSAVIWGNGFTLYCNLLLHIPSPSFENHDNILMQVVGGSLRSSIAGTIAMLSGSYASIYIVTKLKTFFMGRKYWARNLIASSIGEAINTVLVFPLGMLGTLPPDKLLELVISSYIFKFLFVVIQIIPSIFFVHALKCAENLDERRQEYHYIMQE